MTDVIFGAKIQIDTGGTTQAIASTVKGINDLGSASKRTRVQMDALSAGMSSVGKRQWEGIQIANKMAATSTSLLLEQQKVLQKQLATNTAGWAALGEMGAKQMRGIEMANKMAASSTSLVIEKQKALDAQLAKNASGWAALGEMGAKQMRGIEIANKMASASIVSESDKTAKAVDKVGKASEKAGLSFRGWLPHIRTTGAAIGVWLGVRMVMNIAKAADAYTNMSARLRLVASDSTQLANIQSRLYQISQTNQSGLEETTKLYTRMAMGLKDLGRSQAEILNVTDLLGKGMKISGASTVEASAGLLQFAQAMQSGLLAGDEYRSLAENMPRINKAIADGLGVSLGQLRKMSAAQELTSAKAIKALASQSDALNQEAARIPVTLGRAWTELGNAFTKLIGDADQVLGVTKSVAAGIEAMAKVIEKFAKTQSPLEQTREQIRALAEEIQNLRNPGMFTFFADDRLKTAQEQMLLLETRKNRLERESQSGGAGTSRQAQEYIDAASAAWKLTKAQKAVVEQIVKIGEAEGFDPAFLLSIAKAESTFNAAAKAQTTTAAGAFQFVEKTAKRFGVKDPLNVEQATHGAIKYLTVLQRQFKDTQLAAQAYHDGEGAVARAGNRVPADSKDPGYGTRILKNMQALQKAMGNATDAIGKDIAKAEKDQFDAYADGLARREKAYDDYSKIALAKNKTLMDQLSSQQQAATVATEQAMKMGDGGALAQAEEEMRRIIIARNQATQDSIAIEEKAANKRLGNLGMEIAAAQKLGQANEVAKLQAERGTAKAELAAIEESRKQLTIQTNDDLLANARQFAEKRLQIERELLDARSSLSQDQFQATIDDQKAQIDATLGQAQAQAALNEQQRQEATETLTGQAAIAQARENVNAKLRDALTLIQAEKQAALDKLSLDMQMLDYQEQIAFWQRDHADSAADRIKAESELAKIHEQQAVNAQKYLDVINGVTVAEAKARAEAAKQGNKLDAQAVKETQLRMNAYWDQTISRIREYAKLMEEITGQKNPWVDMSVGVMEYAKSVDQISAKYDDLQKQWRKQTGAAADQTDSYLAISEALEQGQAAAALMAQTMLTARQNTEKGSQAYNNLTTAAENFMVVQQLLNVAEGIAAVIKQLKEGDPYTAAIRAAGTAMILASMGISTGFGGGSSSQSSSINRTGTGGGVFGGTGDQASNSIADSIEIIKQNSNTDINYSAAMLRALQGIESAMAGVTNQVIRGVGPNYTGQLGLLKDASSFLNPTGFSSPLQSLGMKMTFSQTAKIVGYGIQSWAQSLNEILKNGFKAVNFTDIEKTTKVFMMTVSKKISTNYTELDNGVTRQITKVFRSIADALTEGADAFGISSEDAMKRMGRVKLDLGKIDFANMSGEEIQKKLSEVFSSMTDTLAKKLMPGLKDFIQLGEGYAKTFFRLADASNRVSVELARLGVDMIAMKDITEKNGDVAKEWVKQSLMAQDGLSANIKQFIDDASAAADSAEELASTYRQIIQANNLMRTAGLDTSGLGYTMTNAAGGLNEFIAAMQSFNENFLSDADRYSGDVRNLTDQFARLGKDLPANKDAFAAMVAGIDTSTEAGQKLFGQMIALSDAFAKVADEAQRIKDKYADILDPFKKFSDQIQEVGKDFATLIGGLTGESKGKIDAITAAANQARAPLEGDKAMMQGSIDGSRARIEAIQTQIAEWEKQLETETDKAKAKQNKSLIRKLQTWIADGKQQIQYFGNAISDAQAALAPINDRLLTLSLQEGVDKIAEEARLSVEKQAIVDDAVKAMSSTLEDVFTQIVQTVQAAQQRVQSVVDLQQSLASQLAQLQGPGAVANLAGNDLAQAWNDINSYIDGVRGGTARNVETEIGLLNTAQQAVMARYNAEIAAIQDAEREYIAAETERLNATLQVRIDAINAATEAAVKAENDRLEAAVKAQGKLDEAAQKQLQKSFDAQNKLTQKQFDAEQKLLQKQFDAEQAALQKLHDAQLEALQDELDAANKLSDAIKGVAEYAQSLKLSANSTLSPEARLAEAQRQYQTLVGQAQGGDADAMGKLAGASDAYLEAAKQYYGSSTNYQDIFDGVQKAMESIGGMSAPDPNSIQSRIDVLREAQAAEMEALRELQAEKLDLLREEQAEKLDAIREIQADQLDALREQQQANIDAMRESSQKVQEQIRDAAQSQIEALQKQTQQAIADLSDPTKNRAMAAAREAAERDMKELQRLAEQTRIEAQIQADEAKRQAALQAQKAFDLANAQLRSLDNNARISDATLSALNAILGNNGLTKITSPGVIPVPQFASGGLAQPGLAIVGEQGPELVRFNRPGQVYTASETKSMLGNDGKVVAAIAELKAEMRAVVTTQSNANPQIIDKLSRMEERLSKMERTQKLSVTA